VIFNRRQLVKYAAKVLDLCILVTSFVVATAVVDFPSGGMTFPEFMEIRITLGNILLFALLLFTWHSLFTLCGLYVSKRLIRRRIQIQEVCKATSLASGFLLASANGFHIRLVTPAFVLIFGAVCTCLMIALRLAARPFLVVLRSRGRNRRFVLIVGTNERATEFAREITEHPELGYQIVGFVDDDWPGIWEFEATGHVLCCGFPGLAEFLRHNVVDEAAIYLPLRSYYEHAAQLVALCEHHGIAIRFDTQIFNLKTRKEETCKPLPPHTERLEPDRINLDLRRVISSPTALRIRVAGIRLPMLLRGWQTDDFLEWFSVSLNPPGEPQSSRNQCP
jgi:FlaA1/EpsC-like NDP-sugar epimerase